MSSAFICEATENGDVLTIPRRFKCYDYVRTIGRGGSAVVISLMDVTRKFRVAGKVVKRPDRGDRDILFLERELRLGGYMDCPYLAKTLDVVYLEDIIIMVMEYCDGGDLIRVGEECISALRNTLQKVFTQVCLAIQYLHGKGIAHRDLKLENILVDMNFDVKICDYGVVCEVKAGCLHKTVCGTMHYMPPEMAAGKAYDAKKADIWALGIVLYAIVAGKSPWESKSDAGMLKEIMEKEIELELFAPPLREIVERCCDRNVETRATIEQVLAMKFLKGEHEAMAMTVPNLFTRKPEGRTPVVVRPAVRRVTQVGKRLAYSQTPGVLRGWFVGSVAGGERK